MIPLIERSLLIVFAVWMLGGIVASLLLMKRGIEKPTRRIYEKVSGLLTWSGLAGLLLWSFEFEQVPVLSIRFFYVLLAIWIGWGLYDIVRYVRVEIPALKKAEADREAQNKWLPKRKK